MKVINMENPHTGKKVANQYTIENATMKIEGVAMEGTLFQSYETNVAFKPLTWCRDSHHVYLDGKGWNVSITTSKYLRIFLGIDDQAIRENLSNNNYLLVNLNGAEV